MLINDVSPLAWLIVAGYLAAALASARAGWTGPGARERQFWFATAILLLFLGLNKQLDLQTFLTEAGRRLAYREGWYEARRLIQAVFVILLACSAFVTVVAISAWLRRSAVPVKFAAMGVVLLFAFIVLRAASFHHMDVLVTGSLGGIRSGWLLELVGIMVILGSALAGGRRSRGTAEHAADYVREANDGAQG